MALLKATLVGVFVCFLAADFCFVGLHLHAAHAEEVNAGLDAKEEIANVQGRVVLKSDPASDDADDAEFNRKAQRFMQWLTENGGEAIDIEFYNFPHGRGLRVNKNITQGKAVIKLPFALSINCYQGQPANKWFQWDCLGINDQACIAARILVEKNRPHSFYKPYIDILPKKVAVPAFTLPEQSPEELMELFQDWNVKEGILNYRRDAEIVYREFFQKHPFVYDPDIYTYDEVKWALTMVSSRAWGVFGMSPLADMANHHPVLGQGAHFEPAGADKSPHAALHLIAARDLTEDEEFFDTYNHRLSGFDYLMVFAFVPPLDQDYASVWPDIHIPTDDRLRDFLVANEYVNNNQPGHYESKFYPIQMDLQPRTLLELYRAVHLTPDEVNEIFDTPSRIVSIVSIESERKALHALEGLFIRRVSETATDIPTDQNLLETMKAALGDDRSDADEVRVMAIRARLQRKLILQSALDVVRSLLAQLPTGS